MSEVVKVPNYTEETVAAIVAKYEADPSRETVEALAAEFNKTTRSIIAKLSTLGVYVKPTVVGKTKTGADVVPKAEFVAKIEAHFGMEMPSLIKMTKADLMAFVAKIEG